MLKISILFTLAISLSLSTLAYGSNFISYEQAKSQALKHAKLNEVDVYFSEIEFDKNDETPEYEMKFYYNDIEYEYEINAKTGAVLDFSQKAYKGKMYNLSSEKSIDGDRAKQIALEYVKLTRSDVLRTKIEFEIDNNQPVYDVELYTKHAKYDFEINSITGQVVKFEQDY